MTTYRVEYRIIPREGEGEAFRLEFHEPSFTLLSPPAVEAPFWTDLEYHKCAHCPLSPETDPRCPLALSLVDVVRAADRLASVDAVDLVVRLPRRTISREGVPAQEAFGSLMGLLIPASGCPHTAYLRPMARFHLPLSDGKETIYRATSMYLLAQYLRRRRGKAVALDLDGLKAIYRNLSLVNRGIGERLKAATERDASVNALVILDMFTLLLPTAIDHSLEEELASYFRPYLEGEEDSS